MNHGDDIRGGRGPYIVSWYDATGRRRNRSTRTTDYKLARRIANKIEDETAMRREGIIDANADRYAAAARQPIAKHLSDFVEELAAKGRTEQHISETESRIRKIVKECDAQSITDLGPNAVVSAIATLREGKDDDEGLSARTCNAYLRAVKSFTRWLVHDRRMPDDPIRHLAAMREDVDRRHERRDATAEELKALIEAAEKAPPWTWRTGRARSAPRVGISGSDRAMLYRVAVGTGFRAAELASLTPESFNLDAAPPTVTVQAAYSKRRRRDAQPIRDDLADLLRRWLADKTPNRPVWNVPEKTAAMLRADLGAAEIPYRDDADRVFDFHSLRHTYVSFLVRGTGSVKAVQELSRHSTPSLTIGRYAHARLHDLAGALSSLPDSARDDGSREKAKATGTYDANPDASSADGAQRIRQQSVRGGVRNSTTPCVRIVDSGLKNRAREDSNPQPSDPKSDALSN